MNRFQDKNITLYSFINRIIVECPKCRRRAIVTKDEPDKFYSERTLKCNNCFYLSKGRKRTFIVELKRNCPNCGQNIDIKIPHVNEKKEEILIRCPNCEETNKFEPRNIEQEWFYLSTGKPTDSYFGLPLWLTATFRGNSFWALNYDHLEYLKEYISADLRERNNRKGWTLVEKLPNWIKSGKNRDKIIKIIRKLEVK